MNALLETIQSLLSGVSVTKDQWISLFGTLLKSVGSILMAKGIVTADSWAVFAGPEALSFYAGIALIVAPTVRDMFKHSVSGQIKTAKALPPADKVQVAETLPDGAKLRMVEAMPDVKSIVAKPTASDGVAAAVKDTSRPKVVSAPMAA